jgi:hypothetical protein
MSALRTCAEAASTELKALVFLEYQNSREIAYRAVEDHANNYGFFTDAAVTNIMKMIAGDYEGWE